jgi:hypothetical protein
MSELKAGDLVTHWTRQTEKAKSMGRDAPGVVEQVEDDPYAGVHDPIYHVLWPEHDFTTPYRNHHRLEKVNA